MTGQNNRKNGWLAAVIFGFVLGIALMSSAAGTPPATPSPQTQTSEYKVLPPPGKKCPLANGFYFTYEFSEKPKMGTIVLKVQVFDAAGQKNASFVITGQYNMPAMSGAHDSGDQEFKLNKKDDYLLPVTVVMRGEWEVKLTFVKDGTPVFRGFFRFNV
jgi:hypothetical protein